MALIAILFILIAIALFFIAYTLSIWGWGSDQGFGDRGYTVTRVDGIQVNVDDPRIDATGSDAVVPIWNSPPRALVEYIFVYLLFIGGPAWLCYAFPVLGRLEKKAILRNHNRNSIYEYINANPGCTREDINKRLSINIGTVCHHVTTLKLWGLISYEENGKFKMIYSSQMMGTGKQADRVVCTHIRNNIARALLQTILKQPGINQKALALMTERDDSTIHWHLKKFSLDGLITIKNDGIYRRYSVNPEYKPILEKHLNKA